MKLKPYLLAVCFVATHIALVAPFVPLANILPAGLGALAISSMALSLILAARWRAVDRLTGGPDKSYRLHRFLGFFALVGTLGHWALASSVGSGVLPVLAESGEDVGNIAAFGLLGMTAAALVRAVPYHVWKLSHMLMGPIFLLAVFHTFFVASPLALGAIPWSAMAVMSALGGAAWIQTLLRKRAPTRLMRVEKLTRFEGGVDVTLRSDTPLPGFRAGQFTTLAHNQAGAEAHPFTIAGGDATTRRFVIRAAGDWTEDFVQNTQLGAQLRVGRGEGRFLPQTTTKRSPQLWVAGGVGITPFLAALERMQPDAGAPVTLIYCVRSQNSAGALQDIEHHAARLPQLDVIVLSSARNQTLTPKHLTRIIQGMPRNTRAYMCGPEGLKALVIQAWAQAGMPRRLHSEQFDFRGAYDWRDLVTAGKPVLNFSRNLLARGRRNPDATAGS